MKKIEKYLWSLGMNKIKTLFQKKETRVTLKLTSCLFQNVSSQDRENWVWMKLSEKFGQDLVKAKVMKIICLDLNGN